MRGMENSAATPPAGAVLVECSHARHAEAILAIFNDAILHSTALYDYHPRTAAAMQAWFHAKQAGGFPVLGYEDGRGRLMGFASYGAFRPYPANKYTVEHSVYIDGRFRGQGLGEALLRLIIERARQATRPTRPVSVCTKSWGSCTPAPYGTRASSSAGGWTWPSTS